MNRLSSCTPYRTSLKRLSIAASFICLSLVTACESRTLNKVINATTARASFEPLNVEPNPQGGNVIRVPARGDVQAALDRAQPGDTIILQAGASYAGGFKLPRIPAAQQSDKVVTIQSSALDKLPAAGVRITPADKPHTAMITSGSNNEPAITTATAARGFRFIGIEFAVPPNVKKITNMIYLESENQTKKSEQPSLISFDRCLIQIPENVEARRGIGMNGAQIEVLNSHFTGFKEQGTDSQALLGWNGSGPYKIINNYLEAASENVMFGGGDSKSPELMPSDIEIRGNHLTKPLAWRTNGSNWNVKNLLELKVGRNVIIDGNLLENSWAAAQSGYGVLFTPRNQYGATPWSQLENVTFSNNIIRHTGNGISILTADNNFKSEDTRNLKIINNLLYDVDRKWGGEAYFVLISGNSELKDLTLAHNTADTSNSAVTFTDNAKARGLTIYGNIFRQHIGVGGEAGVKALVDRAGKTWDVRFNAIVSEGGARSHWQNEYPLRNFLVDSFDLLGFVNRAGGDYRLLPTSPLKRRAEGKDVGANVEAIFAAQSLANRRALGK